MKFLLYSSPYHYYYQNLELVAQELLELNHQVTFAYSLVHTDKINEIKEKYLVGREGDYIKNFLRGKKSIDAVILVQPWWYIDRRLAEYCNKKSIPFYIIDHAPPMILYKERDGKLSHTYRKNLMGSRAFFAYGSATKRIMEARGCKEKIIPIGSPRLSLMLKKAQSSEYLTKAEKSKTNRKLAVIYDTSSRMEDPKVIKKVIDLVQIYSQQGWDFIVKEHPRSSGLLKGTKLINFTKFDEIEVGMTADLNLFTFPSSIMIFLALLGKPMISLYGNHFSLDAQVYSKLYKKSVYEDIDLALEGNGTDYTSFLQDNLSNFQNITEHPKIIVKSILQDLEAK